MPRLTLLVLVAAAAVFVAGCRDASGPGVLRDPSVEISPREVEVEVGSALEVEVVATDSTGSRVEASELVWTSSDGDIAGVDSTGTVWGRRPGIAQVVVRLGDVTGPRDTVEVRVFSGSGAVGRAVVTGARHSCALDEEGRAYCWGEDGDGQVGNGARPDEPTLWPTPVLVAGGRRFSSLTSGPFHTCGLEPEGTAYCWGRNGAGELGDGTVEGRGEPVQVASDVGFTQLVAGREHTCGLTEDGEAFCWGRGVRGQLGTGGTEDAALPVRVAGDVRFERLAAGGWHVCGISDGEAYCWGQWLDRSHNHNPDSTTPIRVEEGRTFTSLDAADVVTCGLLTTGGTRCWGARDILPRIRSDQPTPNLEHLSVGSGHLCGIGVDGAAYCWGVNDIGQLGDGSSVDRTVPTPVEGGHRFAQLSAGWSTAALSLGHTCGITDDGEIYCWGAGGEGQLGAGFLSIVVTPARVAPELVAETVVGGSAHSCALTPSGQAFCWGANGSGQLGDGTATNALAPVAVSGSLRFRQLTAGGSLTCGLTIDTGEAYCWGRNNVGQLGDGTTTDRRVPTPVQGALVFESMDAGAQHVCGLASESAYCWGWNAFGVLGTGTSDRGFRTAHPVPEAVETDQHFASITAGELHTCATTPEGEAYCWGENGHGELGNGETRGTGPSRWTTPTRVIGGVRFDALSAGGVHTCGISTSGTLLCWGGGGHGQLGHGGEGTQLRPTEVVGGLTYRSVSAGLRHTCAIASAGGLFCWGANEDGRLGDGSFHRRVAPVEIFPGGVAEVAAASTHTCAVQDNDALYCWGARGRGQLGDGVDPRASTPIAVAAPFSP